MLIKSQSERQKVFEITEFNQEHRFKRKPKFCPNFTMDFYEKRKRNNSMNRRKDLLLVLTS